MIEIIPAIDVIGGRCVRLSQGDYSRQTTYDALPTEMARQYADTGVKRIHIVDLEGAKVAKPCNLRVLEEVAALGLLDIEWGGGIKTPDDLTSVFDAGADHAIIGSVAVKQPTLMEQWLSTHGGDRIILGADLRDGKVAVAVWLEDSTLSAYDLIDRFLPFGLTEVITTEIYRDGMLAGPATSLYLDLMARYPDITFTVSGGVSSIEDIRALDAAGLSRVIVGKAIYEGRISLSHISSFISENC